MIPQVDNSIVIGVKRYYDASIPNFFFGSVSSLHICIPHFWHWFGFISSFSLISQNHKPCPNSSIITSPGFSGNEVTPVQIGILTWSVYYEMNGDTLRSSKMSDIDQKFYPKQWVSSWFSIPVADALQITFSWFLCNLLITPRSLVLILNSVIFSFSSGTSSASQDFETHFPRWL